MLRKNIIILISLVFIQISFILFSFYFLIQEFYKICPNLEFLSWDADLRFIKTLQLMDHLRNFEILSFLFQLLDSPTWPIFRNLIQIIVFWVTGISANADILITVFTFFILIGLILHVIYYLSEKHWIAGLLFLPAWVFLFLSPPLIIYSFSAMLEIQGAFFFLASTYYILLFYKNEGSATDKKLLIKMALCIFALFNTKYPYGYLLLMVILILHTSLYFEEVILFGTRYLAYISNEFQKQYRIIGIILLLLIYLLFPESVLKGKTKTYIKYLIVLVLSIDFYIYLFKQSEELINLKFEKITEILKWAFLPTVVFVLMHPDRFSSSSSTLAHIQSEGHLVGEVIEKNLDYYLVFLKAITNHSFASDWIGYFLLIGLLLSVVFGYMSFYKEKKIQNHFFFSAFSLFTIFILTFFTPNHQARHIYHLIPAMAVGVLLLIGNLRTRNTNLFFGVILLLSIFVTIPYANKLTTKFSGDNVCYTGVNKDDFFTPREIEKRFKELNKNAIFFNFINPLHVNKADTELVLSRIAYENKVKILINPKSMKQNPKDNGFEEVFLISDSCEKDYLVETWFKNLHSSVKFTAKEEADTYLIETKGKSFTVGLAKSNKSLLNRKLYKDSKFSTGEGCLQIINYTILR